MFVGLDVAADFDGVKVNVVIAQKVLEHFAVGIVSVSVNSYFHGDGDCKLIYKHYSLLFA